MLKLLIRTFSSKASAYLTNFIRALSSEDVHLSLPRRTFELFYGFRKPNLVKLVS